MPAKISALVSAIARTWPEALPAVAEIRRLDDSHAGLDESLLAKYDSFRLAVRELDETLRAVDAAIEELRTER